MMEKKMQTTLKGDIGVILGLWKRKWKLLIRVWGLGLTDLGLGSYRGRDLGLRV